VQRELRALADRAAEDAERRQHHQPVTRESEEGLACRCLEAEQRAERQHVAVLSGLQRRREQRADADQEADVADAVHHERLQLRVRGAELVLEHPQRLPPLLLLVVGIGARRRLVEPEADQQVAAEPHQFPRAEAEEQVVAQHHAQHRRHEEAELPREAGGERVVVHVPVVEHEDQHGEQADDQCHHGAHRVDVDADAEGEGGEVDPGRVRSLPCGARAQRQHRLPRGQRCVDQHRQRRQPVRQGGLGPRHAAGQHREQQRDGQDRERQEVRDHERSSRVCSRSTSLLVR
jgi:hypothetical protein